MSRLLLVLTFAFAVLALGGSFAGADNGGGLPAHKDKAVCSKANGPGVAACDSRVVTETDGVTPLATSTYANGYRPTDLQSAYNLPSGLGSGSTVAIVDAYANPNAESDLAAYRFQFGLPPCTTANGCFSVVNQNGAASPLPAGNTGWGQEIDLDIEMVSAVCPQCKILLVEANSSNFTDLGTAVNTAAQKGPSAISNSYGTSGEFLGETSYDSYYNHPNIAVVASSGDSGYGVEFPAADNHVVAVGGTSLAKAGTARGWSESAWSGAGSGCSAYFAKSSWQLDSGCARRMEADVSAVADPNTGVAVYDTYGSTGGNNWFVFGGTSVASPIIGAVYGLAGNASTVDYPAKLAYGNAAALFDVVGGSNGNCGGSYLCTAVGGYDGPTGLGTPNGLGGFTVGNQTSDFTVGVSPSSETVTQGTSASYTVTVGTLNGFSSSVGLSQTGLANGTYMPPAVVTGSGSSTLSVDTTSISPGTYPFTITGTSGGTTHSVSATLVVQPVPTGDFTISVPPTSATIGRTSTTTYNVTIGPLNGFAGSVVLSATGFVSGAAGSFSPNPTGPGTTLTVTASGLRKHLHFTVTITGTSGALSHSTTLSLST
jgi:subtilase family serine protease